MDPMPACVIQFNVNDQWIDSVRCSHIGCVPGMVRLHEADYKTVATFYEHLNARRPKRIFSHYLNQEVDGWHINWNSVWYYPWLYERRVQRSEPVPIDWKALEKQFVHRPEHEDDERPRDGESEPPGFTIRLFF